MRICKICLKQKDLSLFQSFLSKGKYKSYRTECNECRNSIRRKGRYYSNERDTFKHKQWRSAVLERDKNKCQNCLSDKNLIAHHIVEWDKSLDLRFDLSNGLTLCRGCHMRHHKNHKGKTGQIAWNKGLKTGITPWKGKKFSQEHCDKLALARKGKPSWNKGLTGNKSHMTGKIMSHRGKSWIIDQITGKRQYIDSPLGE